jgi:hypothetical protein
MAGSDSFTTGWLGGRRKIPKFFNRTEPDSISLSQSPVDGARLRHTHLSATDQRRHIGGIGVSVPDKTPRTRNLVNGCFEDPTTGDGVRYSLLEGGLDTVASPALSEAKQASMSYIPHAVEQH